MISNKFVSQRNKYGKSTNEEHHLLKERPSLKRLLKRMKDDLLHFQAPTRDIFNLNEIGLYYKKDTSLHCIDSGCHFSSGNRGKQRISVLVGVNASGTDGMYPQMSQLRTMLWRVGVLGRIRTS
jgi:hypothetical protein